MLTVLSAKVYVAPELCVFFRVPFWPARGIGHRFFVGSCSGICKMIEETIRQQKTRRDRISPSPMRCVYALLVNNARELGIFILKTFGFHAGYALLSIFAKVKSIVLFILICVP